MRALRVVLGMAALACTIAAPNAAAKSAPDSADGVSSPFAAPEAKPGDLRFDVRVEQEGELLRVQGVVTNVATQPLRIGYGACSFRLRLFATSRRDGTPVWSSETGPGVVCRLYLVQRVLAPNASAEPREWSSLLPGGTLPSLAGKTYQAAATMWLAEPRMSSEEIAAGMLVVRPP